MRSYVGEGREETGRAGEAIARGDVPHSSASGRGLFTAVACGTRHAVAQGDAPRATLTYDSNVRAALPHRLTLPTFQDIHP
jgi:hypothetical protein